MNYPKKSWVIVEGTIKKGHQVASGISPNNPYSQGTIRLQTPIFQQLGLDISVFFAGTLNVSLSPHCVTRQQPEYTLEKVQWHRDYPPESFSFSPCQLYFRTRRYESLIYYPHPETKINHFHDPSTLEILAPFIPQLHYGDTVQLEINPQAFEIS